MSKPICNTPTDARCPGDGVTECKKCPAEHVPPAGGEVVIRQYRVVRPDPRDTPYSAWFEIESAEKDEQISRSLRVTEGQGTPPLYEVRELVDRAHVTRLQAEVSKWQSLAQSQNTLMEVMGRSGKRLTALNSALQSELTKARDLLEYMLTEDDMPVLWFAQRIDAFLSNQSAPADKGQGEPVEKLQTHAQPVKWWNGCDSEVPRALRFLANNERPSGGEQRFNAAHLFQLAGEIERMARTPLYAEQPAPVAVVMPERKTVKAGLLSESNTHNQGWNACLDEFARLNSEPKP